jgi:hypothetical protein
MAGLVPAIHVFVWRSIKTWMPATSAGMTICSNFIQQQHPPPARRWQRRYCLFFAVACGAAFCGAGRTSPQGSLATFLSGILSIAAL